MKGTITGEEVLKGVKEEISATDSALKKLLSTYNDLAIVIKNTSTSRQSNTNTSAINKADKEAIDLLTRKARLQKEESNALAAQSRAEKSAIQAKKALDNAEKALQRSTRTNLAQFKSLNSAYLQQSRLLNQLRGRFKDLATIKLRDGQLTKSQAREYKNLSSRISKLDRDLKKVDASAGQFQRNVGNYPRVIGSATRSIRAFVGAFGLTSGIFLLAGALRETVSIFRKFDQSQADLAAVLGRSKKDIKALSEQAKELGATTAFTATQVAQLQLELAKLGFDDSQILAATRGVENLALATGVEAARAAKLAGAALRGFNLDASESNRVASALAVSTTKSASSFETLEVALPKVSAIAKSFGFTLEDTTALLGGLQNAGFEASIAGTSLRQIFLQLADSNGDLAKRLGGNARNFDELIDQFKNLEKEGIDLSEAFQLTNARSVAAFKTFLSGADDLKVLRDSIVDVEDELDKLAETKLDSLEGNIKLLSSAWEGFTLSILKTGGTIDNFLNSTIKGLTDVFNLLTDLGTDQSVLDLRYDTDLKDLAIKEELNNLKIKSIDTGKSIKEVARDSFFKFKTDADKATNSLSDLKEELKEVEEEGAGSRSRGAIKAYNENVSELKDRVREAQKSLAIKQGKLDAVNSIIKAKTGNYKELNDEIDENIDGSKNQNKDLDSKNQIIEGTIAYYNDLIRAEESFQTNEARTTEAIQKSIGKVEEYEDAIKQLRGQLDKPLETQSFGFTNTVQTNDEGNVTADATKERFEISGPSAEELDAELKKIADNAIKQYNRIAKSAEDSAQRQKMVFGVLSDFLGQTYGLDFQNFSQILKDKEFAQLESSEKTVEIAEATGQTLNSINDSLLGGTLNRLSEEEEANRAKLQSVLSNEASTDEEKKKAQAKFDAEDLKIRQRKFRAEQKASIANVIINAGVAIAKAFAINPLTAPVLTGIITAATALQIGTIASQKPPQFFKGKKATDNYEGIASVNELPGQREVRVREDGSFEVFKPGMQYTMVGAKDIITPSITEFNRQIEIPNSDISKRLSKNIRQDTRKRNEMVVVNNTNNELTTERMERVFRVESRKQTRSIVSALKKSNTIITHSNEI